MRSMNSTVSGDVYHDPGLLAVAAELLRDQLAQLVDVELGGVDGMAGHCANRSELAALPPDAAQDGVSRAERVRTARLVMRCFSTVDDVEVSVAAAKEHADAVRFGVAEHDVVPFAVHFEKRFLDGHGLAVVLFIHSKNALAAGSAGTVTGTGCPARPLGIEQVQKVSDPVDLCRTATQPAPFPP